MHELPPSLDDLDRIARQAWEALPANFRELAGEVVFRIEDLADEEMLRDLELEDPLELTGLYDGRDPKLMSVTSPEPEIPMVFLFRQAILYEWIARGDVQLSDLIAHVLVHEIGHHFGLSDEEMDAILDRAD